MRDLECDVDTLAGPVDQRVVKALSKRYPLDAGFLKCMAMCHGGQPAVGSVTVGGRRFRVAEFLTLVDGNSKLAGDFRPHFEQVQTDERVVKSISSVMDCDGNTSRCLFSGLVPFAATQLGMCLDRGYVDLFCLDYRKPAGLPSVVVWDAGKALDAYFDWDSLPFERQFDEEDRCANVNWDSFLIPVAPSFSDFVDMLERNPS